MSKMKSIQDLTNVQTKSCTKCATKSKEPNDGTFISYDPKDSFSAKEQDVDDL